MGQDNQPDARPIPARGGALGKQSARDRAKVLQSEKWQLFLCVSMAKLNPKLGLHLVWRSPPAALC